MINVLFKCNWKNEGDVFEYRPFGYAFFHSPEYFNIITVEVIEHAMWKFHVAFSKVFSSCKTFILSEKFISVIKASQQFVVAILVFQQTFSSGHFYPFERIIKIALTCTGQVIAS